MALDDGEDDEKAPSKIPAGRRRMQQRVDDSELGSDGSSEEEDEADEMESFKKLVDDEDYPATGGSSSRSRSASRPVRSSRATPFLKPPGIIRR